MYWNATEIDATNESDTSRNTIKNISLISIYFIEKCSEYDSDKKNNLTNNIDAIGESSEEEVETLTRRTNSLTLMVPLTIR